jgi:hypothetical protein
MRAEFKENPRIFIVNGISIKDHGKILLDKDEMISFKTNKGKEHDFVAKEWGFYATPSINNRLTKEGFKTALVTNNCNQIYVMVVDEDEIKLFNDYLHKENQIVICWLDEWFE